MLTGHVHKVGEVTAVDRGRIAIRAPEVAATEPSAVCVNGAAPSSSGLRAGRPRATWSSAVASAAGDVHVPADRRDAHAGLVELRRVAGRQVVMARFWLVREYPPEIAAVESRLTCLDMVRCTDGFLAAHLCRPASAAISVLAKLDQDRVGQAVERPTSNLSDGRWHERPTGLLGAGTIDVGYRLVTAG